MFVTSSFSVLVRKKLFEMINKRGCPSKHLRGEVRLLGKKLNNKYAEGVYLALKRISVVYVNCMWLITFDALLNNFGFARCGIRYHEEK